MLFFRPRTRPWPAPSRSSSLGSAAVPFTLCPALITACSFVLFVNLVIPLPDWDLLVHTCTATPSPWLARGRSWERPWSGSMNVFRDQMSLGGTGAEPDAH